MLFCHVISSPGLTPLHRGKMLPNPTPRRVSLPSYYIMWTAGLLKSHLFSLWDRGQTVRKS
jgi:hypothetical protein